MKILDFIDRRDERRFAQGQTKRDHTQWIGAAFLFGYFVLVWQFFGVAISDANSELIKDAMLILGPGVGMVIGALFRRDGTDEQNHENTGRAFEAIREAQKGNSMQPPTDASDDCQCREQM